MKFTFLCSTRSVSVTNDVDWAMPIIKIKQNVMDFKRERDLFIVVLRESPHHRGLVRGVSSGGIKCHMRSYPWWFESMTSTRWRSEGTRAGVCLHALLFLMSFWVHARLWVNVCSLCRFMRLYVSGFKGCRMCVHMCMHADVYAWCWWSAVCLNADEVLFAACYSPNTALCSRQE